MQWPTQLVAPAVATVASFGTSWLAWRRRRTTGAIALLVCMVGVGLWSAFYTLQWMQTRATVMRTFDHLIYLGVVLVPVGWLAIAIAVTRGRQWFTPRRVALLAVEPVLVQVAIWLPSLDHLFFAQQFPQGSGPVSLHLRFGILFWVHSLYSYVLIVTGFVLLARARRRAGRALRRQSKTMLFACAFPFVANFVSITGASGRGSWLRDYDLTPVGFALTGLLVAWALFGQHLFDLVPVARSLVVDTIGDGVLVTDATGQVTDANPAFERLLDLVDPTGVRPVVGAGVLEVLRRWPDEVRDLATATPGSVDPAAPAAPAAPADSACHLSVETAEGRRDLDARRSAIRDRRGRTIGWLVVFHDSTNRLADQRALVAANERLRAEIATVESLRREVEDLAVHDPLTGLYNRRFLDTVFGPELDRSRRHGYPLSVVFFDLDNFKALNDTYGHAAGDAVLTAVGTTLQASVRSSDVACRFGGEEFVVLLSHAGDAQATQWAEAWRRKVEALTVDTAGTPGTSGARLHVTVSAGLATAPLDGHDPTQLLAAADAALYRAKRAGRNCVRTARAIGSGQATPAALKDGASSLSTPPAEVASQ